MVRRFSRSLLTSTLAALLTAAAILPATPQPVAARGGATFVEAVNEYRSDAGARPVRLHDVVQQIAIQRANQMASANEMNHDLDFIGRRLRKAGVCFERVGEIAAYNSADSNRVRRFVNQGGIARTRIGRSCSNQATRTSGAATLKPRTASSTRQ